MEETEFLDVPYTVREVSMEKDHRICALCGAPLPWQDYLTRSKDRRGAAPWTSMQTRTFSLGDLTLGPGTTYQRRRPARTASVESDVVVPGLQATITGILSGAFAAGIAVIRKSDAAPIIGVIGCTATWALAWLWLLHEHRQLLWEVESVIGADLDGDGRVGAPPSPAQPATVRVDITDKPASTETHMSFFELPIAQRKMSAIARSIIGGTPFSEAELVTKYGLLSGPKFRELQDILIDRKMLRWRNGENHRVGVEITRGGLAMFRTFANAPSAPLQSAEV